MKRTVWAGIALWCVTVASAVGIGWVAIELVGDDVGPSATAPLTTPSAVPSSSTTTSAKPTAKPSRRPTPTSRPSATASRPASATATPRTTTTAAPARQVVKTWSGTAGSVRVSCTGSAIKLLAATPADGWRVERAEAGSEVDVRFEREEEETRVEARCGPSGPVFTVETED